MQAHSGAANPGRRPVAMLTHSYYEEDPRVRREAETLAAAGRPVVVYALRRPDDPPHGELEGVRIRRLDVQRHQGAGIGTYVREYLAFLVRAGVAVTRDHRRARFGLVQVHTMPDFLAFAGVRNLIVAGFPGGDLLAYVERGVARPIRDGGDLLDALAAPPPAADDPARLAFLAEQFQSGDASERIAADLSGWLGG